MRTIREFLVVSAAWACAGPLAADERLDYLSQVKPLLRARCYACHGALKQQASLRLDTARSILAGGDSGAAIVFGKETDKSLLLERVSAVDVAQRMPPEHEGEPLSPEQIELLRKWIAAGAPAPDDEQPEQDPKEHWAFRPIRRPDLPSIKNAAWVRNPIDAWISRTHQRQGLTPQVEAPRALLLKRLFIDLIGILPSAEEIAACENDRSPRWYEQTVDRLLGDPRHGERWARHWMDNWRYSDWWGLGDDLRNSQRHIWHWRDWIVEALNNDAPYDEMVRLMLAADELAPTDPDKLRATGYLARNYFLFNRTQWMEETVEHVSKGFLGLTMNCAKCHNHKFDPIAQIDFYRMRAFFEPYHVRLDVVPGEADLLRDGIPRVFDGVPETPTYRFIRGEETKPDKSAVVAPGVPEIFAFDTLRIEPVPLPLAAWQPARQPWVLEAHLAGAQQHLRNAEAKLQSARKSFEEAKVLANSATNGATGVVAGDRHVAGERGSSSVAGAGPAEANAEVQAQLTLAQADFEVAQSELASVEARSRGMRASWEKTDQQPIFELTRGAIQAERLVAVTKARQSVISTQLAVRRAAADKKDDEEKKLVTALGALDKAIADSLAEIQPADRFTPLSGAKWTATRFRFSATDDPPIPFPQASTGRRTALANWITDRRNPLTARVAVNHLWTRHLGESLASTTFDFGRNAREPAHSELIDWLASEFMDRGWSMKHLHRLIVTSATYRMSSSVAGRDRELGKDPDNRFWWRRMPIRLESQAVRDSILSLAGTLDPTMGGPPVLPQQQIDSKRRSLYFFHSNNERNLFLTTFDEALVTECYRREQSIVPQQALALSHSGLVLDSSERIAQQLSSAAPDDTDFVRKAFKLVLGIDAADSEIAAGRQALEAWKHLPDGLADSARSHFVWALFNHNDFVTLR